jgi:hypothetical protein
MVKAFILPFFQKAKIQSETTWFQLGISVDGMKNSDKYEHSSHQASINCPKP